MDAKGRNTGENLMVKILGWLWPLVWLAIVAGMWRLYAAIF